MTVNMENEQSLELPFDWEETARLVIDKALDLENCPWEAEVSLTLVDNERIRELNREYRQIDRATDVLSFPLVDYAVPGDFSVVSENEADYFDPETGELMLGDIVISVERAAEQAAEYSHSLRREFSFLIAHSMLHLMGYDHMIPEEAEVMEARQEAVLAALGITREN